MLVTIGVNSFFKDELLGVGVQSQPAALGDRIDKEQLGDAILNQAA